MGWVEEMKSVSDALGGLDVHLARFDGSISQMEKVDAEFAKTIEALNKLKFLNQLVVWRSCKNLNEFCLEQSRLARSILVENDEAELRDKFSQLSTKTQEMISAADGIFKSFKGALDGFVVPPAMLTKLEISKAAFDETAREKLPMISPSEGCDIVQVYLANCEIGDKFKGLGAPTQRIMTHIAPQGKGSGL